MVNMKNIQGRTRERIYRFLQDFIGTNGYSPSYREVAEAVGISGACAERHLKRMMDDGLIEIEPYIQRSIRIVKPKNVLSKFAAAGKNEQFDMLANHLLFRDIPGFGEIGHETVEEIADIIVEWLHSEIKE